MNPRKLASIQTIKALEPIPGADAIVKASVLGWQVVVKKDEFQPGERCIYCEIDSLLPERPEFEFLKAQKMRIRTLKLRGQVSQGICFPLSLLPEADLLEEGQDVTELLGIRKYEPPVPVELSGKVKGPFPGLIPKTDETRVQVLQAALSALQGTVCYVAEKLDGSSVTYFLEGDNAELNVCSRNLNLLEDPNNSFWRVARELELEARLRSTGRQLALQGELIGPGVQGNKYKLPKHQVYFFNAFDTRTYQYLDYAELVALLAELELPMVPVLESGYLLEAEVAALVQKSIGVSQLQPQVRREGLVIRPLKEQTTHHDQLGRVSFKVINPEFLLKYGE